MIIRSRGDYYVCGADLDYIEIIPPLTLSDGRGRVMDHYIDYIKRK